MTADIPVIQREPQRMKSMPVRLDWQLLLAATVLVLGGILMVFSTTFDISYRSPLAPHTSTTRLFYDHLQKVLLGLAAMLACYSINYRMAQRPLIAVLLILAVAASLVFVLVAGTGRALLDGRIQPSEPAKLVTIVYLAAWLAARGPDYVRNFWIGILPYAIVVGVIVALIFLQPDISAAGTVVLIGAAMYVVAGASVPQVTAAALIASLSGFAVVALSPKGHQRWADYMEGLRDISQSHEHIQYAVMAFVKGGFFGVGLGNSSMKLTYLPFPHTDSVFAVIGEEFGLLGCVVMLALFGLLIWRGAVIAMRSSDMFGYLLAAGISCWLALEVVINVTVMVGLIPVAGNALPFISYGGSSLVVVMAAVGILLNISRSNISERPERNVYSPTDLRRGNRRSRLSGAGSSS